MKLIKQISIFAENKPGKLERITKVLAEEKINILAISIAGSDGFGVIKFVVNKSEQAFRILKQKGFTVSLNEVIGIEMEDKPGGLDKIAQILSKHNLNIENAHVLVLESRKNAFLLIELQDIKTAKDVLQKEQLFFFY